MDYPGSAIGPGDSRAEVVTAIQTRLVEIGCGPLAQDGAFGSATLSSVKLFQTRHGLDADGRVGPATWTELFRQDALPVSSGSALLTAALAYAITQVGVREIGGANRGPNVERYLASLGIPAGNPWCMAFAYCCYDESVRPGQSNPLVKTGKVVKHWELAPDRVKLPAVEAFENTRRIAKGAIFCIDHGNEKGHCGLVVDVWGDVLKTVEGNTNRKGSREGDGVYLKDRRFGEINLGFLDYGRA